MDSQVADGIWIIDADAKTAYANERMGEILGISPPEMVGRLRQKPKRRWAPARQIVDGEWPPAYNTGAKNRSISSPVASPIPHLALCQGARFPCKNQKCTPFGSGTPLPADKALAR